MRTLIVTDIFGKTDGIEVFSAQFHGEVKIISPYENLDIARHCSEKHIYEYFIKNLGHDAYSDKVQAALIEFCPDFIISFSAGATACWRALARTPLKRVHKMIAFYPGQIRHFTDLNPNCHVDIYFPEQEKHFDLKPVINTLNAIPCLSVYKTRYLHGFMNKLSDNYNVDAYSHFCNICLREQSQLTDITDKKIGTAQV